MSEAIQGLWDDMNPEEQRQASDLLTACKRAGIEKPHMRSRRDGSAFIVEMFDDAQEGVQTPLFGATSSDRRGILYQLTQAAKMYKNSR